MKITDPNGRLITQRLPGPKSSLAGNSAFSGAGGSSKSDHVLLSGLGALAAAASAENPQEQAKISSLTATISSGSYQIEAGVLSNRIIEASLIPGQAYI
jgi:anti-sigma28 factor (negative regulator of flagellin synthesis)